MVLYDLRNTFCPPMNRKLLLYGCLFLGIILLLALSHVPELISPVPNNRGLYVTFHSPQPTLTASISATIEQFRLKREKLSQPTAMPTALKEASASSTKTKTP